MGIVELSFEWLEVTLGIKITVAEVDNLARTVKVLSPDVGDKDWSKCEGIAPAVTYRLYENDAKTALDAKGDALDRGL